MVTFNFKSPKTIGGEKTGKVGRPKGCKLVNKVHKDGESQKDLDIEVQLLVKTKINKLL